MEQLVSSTYIKVQEQVTNVLSTISHSVTSCTHSPHELILLHFYGLCLTQTVKTSHSFA
ncbi:hypothetical protein K503DRAFT_777539 [Rhizopogon vinicolor AM-OR11-026]|uniref:Uncharacterized protein n=1 Tax=Rhizopogon vinicolor AM-OR11-026 TaxID=1314800 RepID=A0A1B7MFU6_9AGAM|nr:hypothetical protein K503DRAFT_777539 [Rhizopogon vinicolor AM-OR11-026]